MIHGLLARPYCRNRNHFVLVQFYSWLKIYLPLFQKLPWLSYIAIIIQKQRKIKFETRIKLNRNTYITHTLYTFVTMSWISSFRVETVTKTFWRFPLVGLFFVWLKDATWVNYTEKGVRMLFLIVLTWNEVRLQSACFHCTALNNLDIISLTQ